MKRGVSLGAGVCGGGRLGRGVGRWWRQVGGGGVGMWWGGGR